MPAIGRQQAAEHAQRRGLARAVGSEEAVDLAAPDAHGQVAHHHLAVERLGEPFDVDGIFVISPTCDRLGAVRVLLAGMACLRPAALQATETG